VKKSDFKQQLRNESKRVVPGNKYSQTGHRQYCQDVERGRKQLLVSSNEGGDSAAKRIKGELTYLLNNYLPQYDTRIEALIDAWRTSHDPAYDPGIRVRFRQVQREFMRKSNPF